MEDEWNVEATDDVTTKQLDTLVAELSAKKDAYEEAKRASDELFRGYDGCRDRVLSLMEQAKKKSYRVDGVGLISVRHDLKVKYPSDLDSRTKFLNWVKESKGEETFNTTVSVNYQTLNSLYSAEFAAAVEAGTADSFNIPGLANPTSEPVLSFRRS